jgi:hypothetical protein
VRFLTGVAQARQPKAEPVGSEPLERAPYRLRASDRDDLDTGCLEVEAPTARERLDRALVAYPFHEDGGAHGRTSLARRAPRGLRHQ